MKSVACRAQIALLAMAIVALALPSTPVEAQDGRAVANGLSYLTAFGPRNYPVVSLLYGVIIISLAVVAIIGALVLAGAFRRGVSSRQTRPADVPLERSGRGLSFIYLGLIPSFLVLLGTAVWNYMVLAQVAQPRQQLAATVAIVGHQWWWEVRYRDGEPSREFTTANEMHIPVGQPVRVELDSADVIHSFWVPALSGKTDTIPGQQNVTWMQADRAGTYRGQCSEYCGQQHAHMGFVVIAEAAAQFKSWWDRQLEPPQMPESGAAVSAAEAGQAVFMRRCAVCHRVLGTAAGGRLGPDLSHLMGRASIAAGTIPNTIGYLSAWISDPQHVKPGNLMPSLALSPRELSELRTFLQTMQ